MQKNLKRKNLHLGQEFKVTKMTKVS